MRGQTELTVSSSGPDTSDAGKRRKAPSQETVVLIVTLLMVAFFSITLNGFATIGNFLNVARSVSILGILSLGMGVVVIGRGLDLSQIAATAVSAAIVVQMLTSGYSPWVALPVGAMVALSIGVANGLIIAFHSTRLFS